MLQVVQCENLHLDPAEVETYLHLQKVARPRTERRVGDKVCFHLLNFMDQYEIKGRSPRRTLIQSWPDLGQCPSSRGGLLLQPEQVEAHGPIALPNARLRQLQADTVERGAFEVADSAGFALLQTAGSVFPIRTPESPTKRPIFFRGGSFREPSRRFEL